tara:strand:+ start:74 stop:265 length:192 start_codon:yes stop_codon:yes gene_type:complete
MKMSSANPRKVMIKTTKDKFKKGSKSKTMKNRLDFSTKRGNKDFNIGGKRVVKMRRPFEGIHY